MNLTPREKDKLLISLAAMVARGRLARGSGAGWTRRERSGGGAVAGGAAAGVTWPADAVARVWKRYDALPADGFTSMARDLLAGRPSELDSQTGAVVRLGARHGVPTPVHFRLLEQLGG